MSYIPPKPTVCKFLNFFSFLSVIMGIIGSIPFFINQSYQTSGTISQPLIIPGITVIVGGIIAAVLFRAISEIILFLQVINENLIIVASKYVAKEENTTEQESQ